MLWEEGDEFLVAHGVEKGRDCGAGLADENAATAINRQLKVAVNGVPNLLDLAHFPSPWRHRLGDLMESNVTVYATVSTMM